MNGRVDTYTPVSAEGSEWSGISRYHSAQSSEAAYSPKNHNHNHAHNQAHNNHIHNHNHSQRNGALATPPVSSGSNSYHDDGLPNGAPGRRPPRDGSGNPSPPSSIARSSDGTAPGAVTEESLAEHYVSLKRFLAPSLRDERTNPRSNRAKDKLLRLSAVQFHELSTDVYDELLRRQSASGARRSGPGGTVQEGAPPFLLPEENFHPRRNQARQKLSTLPTSRFKDLSTDVFYELERRFPRFAGVEIERTASSASSMRGPSRRASQSAPGLINGQIRAPPPLLAMSGGATARGPNLSAADAYARADGPNGGASPPGPPGPPGPSSDYERPVLKAFQSNTIVPNKSTIVEDDDETVGPDNPSEDGALVAKRLSKRVVEGIPGARRSRMMESQSQMRQLQEKIDELESRLRNKDEEYSRLQASSTALERVADSERKEWSELQSNLDSKLSEARSLNESLRAELERAREVNENLEDDLHLAQSQPKSLGSNDEGVNWKVRYDDLERRHQELQLDLQEQQEVTEEVRREASNSLLEMKALSDRCGQSWEKEEALVGRVSRLEQEVKDWKHHYARARTQIRNLRASSFGSSIRPTDISAHAKGGRFVSADGRIRDVHVTKFQIAVDELVRALRVEEPSVVLDHMKSVIACTRLLTQGVDETPLSPPPPSTSASASASGSSSGREETSAAIVSKSKSKVSGQANNLITTCKAFASSEGIAPMSLIDAAASNLTTTVVELIQLVKIRPTPPGELLDDVDEDNLMQDTMSRLSMGHGTASRDSVYSSETVSTGQQHQHQQHQHQQPSSLSSSRRVSSHYRPKENEVPSPPLPPPPSFNHGGLHGERAMSYGYGRGEQEVALDELKMYLEDQHEDLVQAVQALVSGVRTEAGLPIVRDYMGDIGGIIDNVVSLTTTAFVETRSASLRAALRDRAQPVLDKLSDCRTQLVSANAEADRINDTASFKAYVNRLPPLAFEVARETKELIQRVEKVDLGRGDAERERFR